jgi:hypothetical protein
MDDRKRRITEARARLADDAPAAWKDYRIAQIRRLENMIRLRAERLRQQATKTSSTEPAHS